MAPGDAAHDVPAGAFIDGSTAPAAPEPACVLEAYLDYAAATPMDPEVVEAMLPYLTERFHNPSAPYAAARAVRADYEAARATLARLIGARPACVTITAGATEANNLAFASVGAWRQAASGPGRVDTAATPGCAFVPDDASASDGAPISGVATISSVAPTSAAASTPDADPPHVVTLATEHESVLACARAFDHTLVGVGRDGRVDPREAAAALRPQTELVSVSLANGEIGCIQPVHDIALAVAAERARRLDAGEARPLWLHVDASQAAAYLSVSVSSLGADLLTLSAAKVYGPKQVGLLWAREGVCLRPLVLGGGQERGVRSGTENVAGAVGFARALELACARRTQEARHIAGLRGGMQKRLARSFPWMLVWGPRKPKGRLPSHLSLSFPGLEARRLVILLEGEGVSVGTGSACAASRMERSHVLAAIGLTPAQIDGSLRISLGHPTTQEQIDRACDVLERAVRQECARLGIDPASGEPLADGHAGEACVAGRAATQACPGGQAGVPGASGGQAGEGRKGAR